MTPEERDLITGLFSRLRAADTADKDHEAEALIRRATAELPSAPYLLVQTVLVQEQALKNAQARIAELERQVAEAQAASRPAAAPRSFLGGAAGLGGPWGRRAGPAPEDAGQAQSQAQAAVPSWPTAAPAPRTSPSWGPSGGPSWGPAAVSQPAAPAGGGFLRSALSTAAGVAGGALLFEGIQHLLGHDPGMFAPYLGTAHAGALPGAGEIVENTTVNNYYGEPAPDDRTPPGDDQGYPGDEQRYTGDEQVYQDADLAGDNPDFADPGTDLGDTDPADDDIV